MIPLFAKINSDTKKFSYERICITLMAMPSADQLKWRGHNYKDRGALN